MIVAGVSIFNIMMMSVTERIKEIGIMRSIGYPEAGSDEYVHIRGNYPWRYRECYRGGIEYNSRIWNKCPVAKHHEVLFVWSSAIPIIEGVCFGIIISLACGVYPAWKAANLIPIEAMRHE